MEKYLIPPILFIICTLIVRPWKQPIKPKFAIPLVLIDALSWSSTFNLNFYKLYGFFSLKMHSQIPRKTKIFLVALIGYSFLSGLLLIALYPDLRDPLSSSTFSLPIFKMLRNQFTICTTILFSACIYLNLKKDKIENVFKPLEWVGIIIAVGIYIEVFFKFNLMEFLSGWNNLVYGTQYFRARGFSYEPRGAAQVLAFCLTYSVLFSKKWMFLALQVLGSAALFYTLSISGIILTTAVYSFIILKSISSKDFSLMKKAILAVFFSTLALYVSTEKGILKNNFKERAYLYSTPAEAVTLTDKILNKFEVFDAAYLNFLRHNPKFIILGTGSGLGGIASQKYALQKDYGSFPAGSASLPLMGGIYLIAQFGIIFGFALIYYTLRNRLFKNDRESIFVTLVVGLFLLQYYYFLSILFALFMKEYLAKPAFVGKSLENQIKAYKPL